MAAVIARRGLAAALAIALASCDAPGPNPTGLQPPVTDPIEPPPTRLVISNPALIDLTLQGNSVSMLSNDSFNVVYVSLASGSAPTGVSARIRRVGDAVSVATPVRNGGFDPVIVEAAAFDSIEVTVTDNLGAVVFFAAARPKPTRPPVIIRTSPPVDRPDVPLNVRLVVVFSEPVAPGSVNASSVRLFRGADPVAGTVEMVAGTGVIVAFTPAADLDANTSYRLDVSTAIRDLSGEALASAVSVPFRTGQGSTGREASVTIAPDTVYSTEGATHLLSATVRDASGNELIGNPVSWASNDTTGLTVTPEGAVTARAPGLYNVIATVGSLTGFARVVVAPGVPALVSLAPSPASVAAGGDTIILSTTVYDARGRLIRYPALAWSSSAPAVATVAPHTPASGAGGYATVTGVTPGSASITASASGVAGVNATSLVTVTSTEPVGSVSISISRSWLLLGLQSQATATIRDVSGRIVFGRPVTWTSENTAVASVDAAGLVRAHGAGITGIVAASGGVADTQTVTVPDLRMRSITAGTFTTCGVTFQDQAWCWGDNLGWQLGNAEQYSTTIPWPVAGGLTWTMLSVGKWSHTCGLASGGAAWCWGWGNYYGELGDGTTSSRAVPARVAGNHVFTQISAGSDHTCALTAAGAAWCWGRNQDGELGDGTATALSAVPVAVAGNVQFTSISAGGGFTCGLNAAGAAYCWGENRYGQLGVGDTVVRRVPVATAGGHAFVTISVGIRHACAVTSAGASYCWGDNVDGQLGTGSSSGPNTCRTQAGTSVSCSLTPVRVAGPHSFVQVGAGDYHTCGITGAGAAYCWGYNYSGAGALGNGTTVSSASPLPVSGGHVFNAAPVGGFGHTCATTSSGPAYCWGFNLGQLGNNSFDDSSTPVRIAGQP